MVGLSKDSQKCGTYNPRRSDPLPAGVASLSRQQGCRHHVRENEVSSLNTCRVMWDITAWGLLDVCNRTTQKCLLILGIIRCIDTVLRHRPGGVLSSRKKPAALRQGTVKNQWIFADGRIQLDDQSQGKCLLLSRIQQALKSDLLSKERRACVCVLFVTSKRVINL